ncbi:hypothetical protein RclHR1_18770013 [Rhizophagus clarus]|uniref:Uncharacterized protein n=1 Tax=Rhizophagus clarus TaxID=94130 RepID=A0A2Z6RG74_9GLOM|nr:hypothetical protein RclHR1_18770013 [Rhizophagus clarus]
MVFLSVVKHRFHNEDVNNFWNEIELMYNNKEKQRLESERAMRTKRCHVNISSKTQDMMENMAEETVELAITKKKPARKRKSISYVESSEEEDCLSDPDYVEKPKRSNRSCGKTKRDAMDNGDISEDTTLVETSPSTLQAQPTITSLNNSEDNTIAQSTPQQTPTSFDMSENFSFSRESTPCPVVQPAQQVLINTPNKPIVTKVMCDKYSPYLVCVFSATINHVKETIDEGTYREIEKLLLMKNRLVLQESFVKKLESIFETDYAKIESKIINETIVEGDSQSTFVLGHESDIIKKLPKQLRENFMKPARNMVPTTLPGFIRKKCNEFVRDFASRNTNKLPRALLHDGRWKESNEKLAKITDGILETLNDSWNNSAFSPEEAEVLNEITYLTNLIVPAIRASLKNLPHGKFTYISTYERQSIASADRRKRSGRRPDIIFVMMDRGKKYELMYTECSRLFCTEQKIKDDAVKIWRETNDGMYWVYKGRRPEKDEFGIIGLQVAGSTLRLTVLIRDGANVDRYYHLHESRIPVQKSEPAIVAKFIETLLILRNILIVNMSLLPHGSTPKSDRQKEDSTTVDSE